MSKKTTSIVLIVAVLISIGAGLFAHYRFPNKPEVQENVVLGQYKDLNSGIKKEETTDEEIKETLDDVIESRGGIYKEAPDGTVSEEGDKLHISYYNVADGPDFTTEADIVLGSEDWPSEFSKTLDGVERSFAAYITTKENEEDATYHVAVLSISLPSEIDDEYVKNMGIEDIETVEALKEDIKKHIDSAHEEDYKTQLTDYLENTVTDSSTVTEIPEDLIESYKALIDKKIENMASYYNNQSEEEVTKASLLEDAMKADEFVGSADEYVEWYAKSQAKTYLVMEKIAEIEGIETDPDKLYSDIANDWMSSDGYDTLYDYIKDNNKEDYERQLLVDTVLEYLMGVNN